MSYALTGCIVAGFADLRVPQEPPATPGDPAFRCCVSNKTRKPYNFAMPHKRGVGLASAKQNSYGTDCKCVFHANLLFNKNRCRDYN
jgi:hypothetical protein